MSCEQGAELLNSRRGGCRSHVQYLEPFGKGVHDNEESVSPKHGHAKSMCKRSQGAEGNSQGWSGAFGGECRVIWYWVHSLMVVSKLTSIRGHHTKERARAFILVMSG